MPGKPSSSLPIPSNTLRGRGGRTSAPSCQISAPALPHAGTDQFFTPEQPSDTRGASVFLPRIRPSLRAMVCCRIWGEGEPRRRRGRGSPSPQAPHPFPCALLSERMKYDATRTPSFAHPSPGDTKGQFFRPPINTFKTSSEPGRRSRRPHTDAGQQPQASGKKKKKGEALPVPPGGDHTRTPGSSRKPAEKKKALSCQERTYTPGKITMQGTTLPAAQRADRETSPQLSEPGRGGDPRYAGAPQQATTPGCRATSASQRQKKRKPPSGGILRTEAYAPSKGNAPRRSTRRPGDIPPTQRAGREGDPRAAGAPQQARISPAKREDARRPPPAASGGQGTRHATATPAAIRDKGEYGGRRGCRGVRPSHPLPPAAQATTPGCRATAASQR